MSLPAAKRPFAILAMLLLAWTQCFGVGRGYICFCSGKPVETLVDHCHGPHGPGCVESHTLHYHHHEDGDGDHHDADTERHTSVKKELKLPQIKNTPTAPVYVATMVAVLPLTQLLAPQPGVFHLYGTSSPPSKPPSPGIRLPHTVALLI